MHPIFAVPFGLVGLGLVIYWGYNTLGIFCPAPRLGPVPGDARNEFVKVLQAATKARKPEVTEGDLKTLANKFLMQPMIIAVGAKVTEGKIPEIEQVLSAGAAAMNIMNATRKNRKDRKKGGDRKNRKTKKNRRN